MQQSDLFNETFDDETDAAEATIPPDPVGREYFETDVGEKSPYAYFMKVDSDMRDWLGPIETIDDAVTGREMKRRWAKIAMVRGQTDENMKQMMVYLTPFPHIRSDHAKALQGWYSGKTDGDDNGMTQRNRPCESDAILTSPYSGYCNVACPACYINAGARGYRGSGLINVPMNYGAFVRKQLQSMQWATAGYFSSFTDPFLEVEEYYHNTQEGATAFVDAGLPIFFLSRLPYPSWSIDLMRRNPLSYAQKSINTSDAAVWHRLSPGAIKLEDNFDQVKMLHDAGVYVSIQVNPVIPGVVSHEDIEALFERLAAVGADHVIVKFVEANHPWARALEQRMAAKFPGARSDRFKELFTERSCGGQRTIIEWYRREGHERYQRKARALGLSYATCYEFSRRPNGQFVSINPEFMTSEQCHGQRVPMHFRKGDHFEPLEVCPPHGCLRCADAHDEGEVPCGSELLGQAQSWKMSDFKKDPLAKIQVSERRNVIPLREV